MNENDRDRDMRMEEIEGSVKIMTKPSGVQLQQKDGPSVTLGNALLKVVRLQLSL